MARFTISHQNNTDAIRDKSVQALMSPEVVNSGHTIDRISNSLHDDAVSACVCGVANSGGA